MILVSCFEKIIEPSRGFFAVTIGAEVLLLGSGQYMTFQLANKVFTLTHRPFLMLLCNSRDFFIR